MKGKRRITHSKSRGKRREKGKHGGRRMRQDKYLIQLVVAGAIFVLLTALKLLLPEGMTVFAGNLQQNLGENADFKAAFSAVGEAIAGEQSVGDSLQEAYTAVFAPQKYHAQQAAAVYAMSQAVELPAMRLRGRLADSGKTVTDGAGEVAATTDIADHSLIYFGAAPPANVSFEQVALGFAYTTPTVGTMTSCFGYREHPIDGDERFHYGLDIASARGTEICAFAEGTVKATGKSSSLGKYVMLSHDGGFTTLYAHCDKVTASAGQTVAMGEKIAEMGDSGAATGTHLHFELLQGSTYLNPIYYVEVY